jgi:hypothetical protein
MIEDSRLRRTLAIIGSGQAGLGDSDRAALGLALRLGSLVAAYCPPGDERAAVYALAAGAAEVHWLEDADALEFDLALLGLGALSQLGDMIAGVLAERSRATLLFDVLDVQRSETCLVVWQDAGRGSREVCKLRGPAAPSGGGTAVLVASDNAARAPYVSRYKLQRAAQALAGWAERRESHPDASEITWQPARPRPRTGQQNQDRPAGSRLDSAFGIGAESAPLSGSQIIQAEPAICAQHLLRYLAHHGFIRTPDAAQAGIDLERIRTAPQPGSGSVAAIAEAAGAPSGKAARGPRPAEADDSAQQKDFGQQLARRPRPIVETPTAQSDLPARIARRPRPLDQAGEDRRRGPRPA